MRDVAFVALGSNLGDRSAMLARARAELAALPGVRVVAASSIEETLPLGGRVQDPYLNQMIALESDLTPSALLHHLLEIEGRLGRVRHERWGSRVIDLDLVLMERQTSDDPGCRVPHPELPNRDFWQRELAELRGTGRRS